VQVSIENRSVVVRTWQYDIIGATGHIVPLILLLLRETHLMLRRGKRKRKTGLAIWAFLPFLFWHFSTLCAVSPLAFCPREDRTRPTGKSLDKPYNKEVTTMTKDPVCKLEIDKKTVAATSTYGGQTYYFCAQGCKEKFDQDPEKYTS
jgi:YHS domain-containing protein